METGIPFQLSENERRDESSEGGSPYVDENDDDGTSDDEEEDEDGDSNMKDRKVRRSNRIARSYASKKHLSPTSPTRNRIPGPYDSLRRVAKAREPVFTENYDLSIEGFIKKMTVREIEAILASDTFRQEQGEANEFVELTDVTWQDACYSEVCTLPFSLTTLIYTHSSNHTDLPKARKEKNGQRRIALF